MKGLPPLAGDGRGVASRIGRELPQRQASPWTQPAEVELAQEGQYVCCQTANGKCTGFWGTSTASLAGTTRDCWRGFQYAWVTACRDVNSGALTAVSSGCGVCAW